ncbi:MAG: protein tyrosine kinase modulator [Acidobacteriota bacterium]|jgi:polysaccharide chain length determinant protein (PEP-CTERM system associated)|nr:protein tyrosine kinase modulator [Acidobacteriota bacterium]
MSVDFRQRKPAELARIIWRRKWLILLPTAAVAVAVAAVVWRLPNVYESTTLLTVRPASIATSTVAQLSDSDLTLRINNITQEVTSRSVLEPLIKDHDLYAAERRRGVSMEELVERMRTKDLKITLNTSRNEITNGFFLAFRGQEPRATHDVTEKLARKYVDSQTKAAGEEATLTKEFFTERVDQEKKRLDDIDARRLQAMQRNLSSLPTQTQALVGQLAGLREEQKARITEIGRLNDQVAYLNRISSDLGKVDQQQVEEVIAQMQDPKSTPAYAELIKRQADLESQKQDLALTFKPAAPEMKSVQKQIDELQRRMNEMVEEHKRKVEETRARLEGKLDPRVNTSKGEIARIQGEIKRQQSLLDRAEADIASVGQRINSVPGTEVELEAIQREYQTEKAIYDQAVEQQNKAEIGAEVAGRAQGESIAVIDPASTPQQPVAPNRPVLMLMGLFAGLACGVVLAAAFEVPRLLTVQTAEDAEHYTGLPVLVTLPMLLTPREERRLKTRRAAFALAAVIATVLSAPALAFVLSRLHIIEMFTNRG